MKTPVSRSSRNNYEIGYYQNNPDQATKKKKRAAEWYRNNAEEVKKKKREKYLQNPTRYKEETKTWRADNPEKKKETADKNYKAYVNKQKANYRQKLYGLSEEDYELMLEKQAYSCAICSCELKKDKSTHIDHNHTTGKIRAVLCHGCNTSLGGFKDNIDILKKAISYLEKYDAT